MNRNINVSQDQQKLIHILGQNISSKNRLIEALQTKLLKDGDLDKMINININMLQQTINNNINKIMRLFQDISDMTSAEHMAILTDLHENIIESLQIYTSKQDNIIFNLEAIIGKIGSNEHELKNDAYFDEPTVATNLGKFSNDYNEKLIGLIRICRSYQIIIKQLTINTYNNNKDIDYYEPECGESLSVPSEWKTDDEEEKYDDGKDIIGYYMDCYT